MEERGLAASRFNLGWCEQDLTWDGANGINLGLDRADDAHSLGRDREKVSGRLPSGGSGLGEGESRAAVGCCGSDGGGGGAVSAKPTA